jgi:hypothetical protein
MAMVPKQGELILELAGDVAAEERELPAAAAQAAAGHDVLCWGVGLVQKSGMPDTDCRNR